MKEAEPKKITLSGVIEEAKYLEYGRDRQSEIDRLKEENKDYAALLVKYHAEEARFLQMRAEAAALRVALEEAYEYLTANKPFAAGVVIQTALNKISTPSL